jgi:hypothetical protein
MLKPLLNKQYKYDCVNGSSETPEHFEVRMTSLQIPYRWYNIPDGVYTTRSVNAHIQQLCIDNGLCFIEDRTPYCFVYYLSDPRIPFLWYNIPDGVYTTTSVNAHIWT